MGQSSDSSPSHSFNYFLTKEEALQALPPGEQEVNDCDYWCLSVCYEPYPVNEIEDMTDIGDVQFGPGIEHTCALPPVTDNCDPMDLIIGKPRRRFK